MRLTLTPLFLLLTATACARDDNGPDDQALSRGPRENAVTAAANSQGIDTRVLLSAAFVQSNFGTDMSASGQIPGVTRTTPFGLFGNATAGSLPQDLAGNARTVARGIRDLARTTKPTVAFDWLKLTAQVIVGVGDSSPLAQLQARIMLNELIAAYNDGFVTVLPDGEVISLPPASSPIDLKKLDPERTQALQPGSLRADYGSYWSGAGDAESGEKYITEIPKIVLRWCPASALVCFDHLRFTTEAASHLMAYRGADGTLQFVQLHPLKKDLTWYGNTASNVVSITLTGLAGDKPDNLRPEWFTWKDYVGLQQNTRRILQAFASFLSPEALTGDISRFVLSEDGITPVLPTLNPVPEGKPKFSLPLFWDRTFFSELLAQEKLNSENMVRVKSPGALPTFSQTMADFVFESEETVSQLVFSSDILPQLNGGQSWELIRRSAQKGEKQEYRFQEQFVGNGVLSNKMRALRVVARNAAGQPIGLVVQRFRLEGL